MRRPRHDLGCRIIKKNYVIKQLFHKTFFEFTMPLCLFYTAKLIKPLLFYKKFNDINSFALELSIYENSFDFDH
jgi:hypothetical protein